MKSVSSYLKYVVCRGSSMTKHLVDMNSILYSSLLVDENYLRIVSVTIFKICKNAYNKFLKSWNPLIVNFLLMERQHGITILKLTNAMTYLHTRNGLPDLEQDVKHCSLAPWKACAGKPGAIR